MNEIQESAILALKKWFDKAENWQKDLFVQLWQGNEDIDKLISRGFSLAKNRTLYYQHYTIPKLKSTPIKIAKSRTVISLINEPIIPNFLFI